MHAPLHLIADLSIKRWSLFLCSLSLGLDMWLALANKARTVWHKQAWKLLAHWSLSSLAALRNPQPISCEWTWTSLLDYETHAWSLPGLQPATTGHVNEAINDHWLQMHVEGQTTACKAEQSGPSWAWPNCSSRIRNKSMAGLSHLVLGCFALQVEANQRSLQKQMASRHSLLETFRSSRQL